MLFTDKERSALEEIVIAYDFKARGFFKRELQRTLAESCLNKLETLNALTYFTKQEFTLLLFAAQWAKDNSISVYKQNPLLITSLINRLGCLAEPIR